MIKLTPPDLNAGEVFSLCISRIRDDDLKARLSAIKPDIETASEAYIDLATNTRIRDFVRADTIGGNVTTREMEKVYTDRMVKKNSPGRATYDTLMSLAEEGRCPLCAHRDATTLDHHLPKAAYPVLAVTPMNLVPACSVCNKIKLALVPADENEETLHPYFDNFDNVRWLSASLHETIPASLRFSVSHPAVWGPVQFERMKFHFKTLGLAQLYASQAADELNNIRHQLKSFHTRGGMVRVRTELFERAQSAAQDRVNGWRVSAYEAFAESDWFCDGGFNCR